MGQLTDARWVNGNPRHTPTSLMVAVQGSMADNKGAPFLVPHAAFHQVSHCWLKSHFVSRNQDRKLVPEQGVTSWGQWGGLEMSRDEYKETGSKVDATEAYIPLHSIESAK